MNLGPALRALLLALPDILKLVVRWLGGKEKRDAKRDMAKVRKALALGDSNTLSRKLCELLEDN